MIEKSLKGINLVIGVLLVIGLTVIVTSQKFVNYKIRHDYPEYASAVEIDKRLKCLAMNIYKEAAHEPFEGKVAIAQVTINRVESGKFPDDVCAVVHQKNKFMEKVVCQFSWYCDSGYRNAPMNKEQYDESFEVAKKVLLEGFRLEVLHDALYYHADYVNPNWNLKRITKIGSHIFYEGKKNV